MVLPRQTMVWRCFHGRMSHRPRWAQYIVLHQRVRRRRRLTGPGAAPRRGRAIFQIAMETVYIVIPLLLIGVVLAAVWLDRWSVPGPPVPLHPGLPVTGQVNLTFAPDMTSALVWSGPGNRGDLHHITLDGANVGPLVPFNTGGPKHVFDGSLSFTADGTHVLLLSDHESQFAEQFYLADIAAPEALPVRINAALADNRKVMDAFVLPDPAHAIYIVGSEPKDLFHASLDPVGEVVQLNPPDHDVTKFCMLPTPDGQRTIYSATSANPERGLYLVELGAEPVEPVELTAALPRGMEVFAEHCALTPDAEEVLFIARDADGPAGLYMTPITPEVGAAVEVSTPGDIVRIFVSL